MPAIRRHSLWLVVPCVALLRCDNYTTSTSAVPDCPNVALLRPVDPRLNLGDTLTMHVASWASRCLPPDTTAVGVRWRTPDVGVVAIDSMTGHVVAIRPGLGLIYLSPAGVAVSLWDVNPDPGTGC